MFLIRKKEKKEKKQRKRDKHVSGSEEDVPRKIVRRHDSTPSEGEIVSSSDDRRGKAAGRRDRLSPSPDRNQQRERGRPRRLI